MSLFKQLAGETVVYGLSHVLGKVLNYVLIAFYLTRKLSESPAEYGMYNELYFYLAMLLIIFGLRMETTFFRFGSQKDDFDKAFSNGIISMLAGGILWFLPAFFFAEDLATWMSYPGKGIYIQVLSALLMVDLIIAMPLAKMRLERKPLKFALFQTGSIVLNIFFVLFFLEWCPSANGGFGSEYFHPDDILLDVFLANLIARIIILFSLFPQIVKVKFSFDASLWKRMLNYAWPLVFVGMAGVINQSSYITLQKYFLPGDLMENLGTGGVYAAAAKVALLMSIFVTAYNFAAEPFFFGQARRKDAPYIYAEMARAFSWVASFILLSVMLFLDFLQYIVDANFRSVMFVVPIILVGYFFLGLYYNIAIWYKVKDKTIFGALISFGGVLVTFVINYTLLSSLGAVASAWAALGCYAFMAIVGILIGRKYLPVPYNFGKIALSLALALSLAFLADWILPTTLNVWVNAVVRSVFLVFFLTLFYFFEKEKIKEWLSYK